MYAVVLKTRIIVSKLEANCERICDYILVQARTGFNLEDSCLGTIYNQVEPATEVMSTCGLDDRPYNCYKVHDAM